NMANFMGELVIHETLREKEPPYSGRRMSRHEFRRGNSRMEQLPKMTRSDLARPIPHRESSPANERVLVVVVNYRTAALVVECLASLEAEIRSFAHASVVVADNDSRDGSFDVIATAVRQRGFESWARVVALPRNGGYAYGNNAVIGPALATGPRPDYVLLLNP